MKPRFLAVIVGIVFVAVLAVLGWRFAEPDPAPQLTYSLIDGKRLTPEDLRGKVVLVNFWATSCVTCVKEMPALVDTWQRFHERGYETIAVAMAYDRPDYVLNFAKTRKLPFRVALDVQGEAAKAFGDVAVTPTSFLIDREGRIIKRWVGEPDFGALHALIDERLRG